MVQVLLKEIAFVGTTTRITGLAYNTPYTIHMTTSDGSSDSDASNSDTGTTSEAPSGVNVYYDDENVGEYFADILVEKRVIIELKTVESFEKIHEATIEGLKQMEPEVVMPMHCTGWRAIQKFQKEFASNFVLNSVGSKLTLSS